MDPILTLLALLPRSDLLFHLMLAAAVGGLIGLEREYRGKPAGLRTTILICVGATLLTDLSVSFAASAGGPADPARLAAQIVSGIGFLGAGTILQSRGSVSGLTSAATLWVVAAIGIAIGSGHRVEAVGTALLVLVVLLPLGTIERWLDRGRPHRRLIIEVTRGNTDLARIREAAVASGLSVQRESLEIDEDRARIQLHLMGRPKDYRALHETLSAWDDVRSLRML